MQRKDGMRSDNAPKRWFMGSDFTRHVAQAITQYGPISRTALSQILGLSQGALSRITSDLIYAGVIEEINDSTHGPGRLPRDFTPKERAERRGRPRTSMRLRAEERSFVGVSVHDTDVSVIVIDALCHELTSCHTESLVSTEPQAVIAQIAGIVNRVAASVTPSPVLVGVGIGAHTREGVDVTYAPFLHWDDTVHVSAMLEEACGIPTVIANDLNTLLVYENWFGAGIGLPRFALLTIGVGVGYALSEHGHPVDDPDNSYGLIGHVLVDNHGPRCFAGHEGCAQCLTTASLAQEYSTILGQAVGFDDFAHDARAGTPQAQTLINRTCFRLGTLIATAQNFALPHTILISGEISFLARLNTESIRSGIRSFRPSQAAPVKFTILDFSWTYWAKAAAGHAIAQYIG